MRRLTARAHKQQQAGQGHRIPAVAKGHDAFIGQLRCLGEDFFETNRPGQREDEENAQGITKIADAVDNESFDCGGIGRRLVIPKSDEQI